MAITGSSGSAGRRNVCSDEHDPTERAIGAFDSTWKGCRFFVDVSIWCGLNDGAEREPVLDIFSRFGSVERIGGTYFFDAHRAGSSLSRDVVSFHEGSVAWETEDNTNRPSDVFAGLSDLFRAITVCEVLVTAGLSRWWAIGINLSTPVERDDSDRWFSSLAAFRAENNRRLLDFVHFDITTLLGSITMQ